ncbi:phage transcriptional regulator, AlpA [Caballeronia turbans]|nr:phage transcriptional regulator, AlpA [Caballeronia turbans]
MSGRNSNQIGQKASFEDASVMRNLTPAAVAHWPVAIRQLRDADVLDAVDARSLASYCEAFARWCAAGEEVAKMLIEFGVASGRRVQQQTGPSQGANSRGVVGIRTMTEPIRREPKAIMRLGEVKGETGLSRSTIYSRMKAGTFPAAVRLGARSVGWRVADIEAFLASPSGYKTTTGGT